MNLKQIEIISIPVNNQQIAKEFYQNILGFELLADASFSENMQWIQLAPSTTSSVSIALVTWFEEMPPGSVQGLVIGTNKIEKDYQELIDKGITLSPIQDDPWGKSTTFKDPDGNGWVLQQSR
ncbi:MAG: VOC family protein [Pleurocapsa sp.]